MPENKKKRPWSELDSFYDARIIIFLLNKQIEQQAKEILLDQGFSSVSLFNDADSFSAEALSCKHDLIIVDLKISVAGMDGYGLVSRIRENDVDVALITVSSGPEDCFLHYLAGHMHAAIRD
ncbi:MAG: hypothetical protein ACRCUT_10990, partial [Spirochaetota bacterium]